MSVQNRNQESLMLESFKEQPSREAVRQIMQNQDQSTSKQRDGQQSVGLYSNAVNDISQDDLQELVTGKHSKLDGHLKAKVGVQSDLIDQEAEVNLDTNAKIKNKPNQQQVPQSNVQNYQFGRGNQQKMEDLEERDDLQDIDKMDDLSLEEIKSINGNEEDDYPMGFGEQERLGADIPGIKPDDMPIELLRRGTTQIFALDADNELSYSKMQALINQNHPRAEVQLKNGTKAYKQLPFCKTRIGWHCCCRPCRRNDINRFGEGTTYYFKMLKFLIILFAISTIINVPLFVLYSVGGGTNDQTGLKYYLSGLSLAYMGSNSMACNYQQVIEPQDTSVTIFFQCDQGFLCDLQAFGLDYSAVNSSNSISSCNSDKYIYYDQYCNMSQFNQTTFNYVTDQYDSQCKDKQSCNLTLSLAQLPDNCKNFTGNRTFFAQAQCTITGISFSASNYLDKSKVAIIIAIFDVVFAAILGLSLLILKCLQSLEHLEIKGITIDASKFTIQLSGLPVHKNIYYLKAEIWQWAENQLKRIKDDNENENDDKDHPSPKSNQVADQSQNGLNNKDKTMKTAQEEDGGPHDYNNLINRKNIKSPQASLDRGLQNDQNDEQKVQDGRKNKIVDISLGLSDYDNVIHLCYLNMFYKQLRLSQLRLEKVQAPKLKIKMEKQIEMIKFKIQTRLDMYDAWVKMNVQTGIVAFIQFRSMLDMLRFLTGFELTFFENLCFGCSKKKPHIQAKMLQGTWPIIGKSPDPANLLWVNLRYSKCNTFWRRFFIAIVSIILMAGSFIAIIYAKDFEKQVQLKYNMNTDCGTITYTQAQVIYQEQTYTSGSTQFNYLNCYCLQQYKSAGKDVVNIKFSDGNYYCSAWATDYAISNMFVYVVAIIIVACNIIVKGILRYITYFEKPKTVGIRSFSIMIKIFVIQFVNTVMILILVNWRITSKVETVVGGISYQIPQPIFGDNFVIFSGRYSDFTPEFFKSVGTTLLLTMIINIVSPNFINYAFYLMKKCSQCCDRGCTLDKRRTKLLIQEDYEALYMGPELQFEGRYATLLTTFYACLFLSFGMPLFYFVGLLSFLFTFYIDKFLFLRYYKLPPLGDRNLALWSRILMAVAVMFHLIVAFMMISNNNLFGSFCGSIDFSSFQNEISVTLQAIPFIYIIFDPKRFSYSHSILIFVFMSVSVVIVVLFIALGSIIYSFYLKCKKSLKMCKKYCQPGGCCAGCGKCCSSISCTGCLKKTFCFCFSCACCQKCKGSCGGCSVEGFLNCGCLKTPCCKKTFSCCFKGDFDLVDGMKVLIDYKPLFSFDFYKEISLYELRLLYLRTNYELKRLEMALGGDRLAFSGPKGSLKVELDVQHPLAFIEQREHFLYRKAAIEIEVKARLVDLQAKAKISADINLNIEAGLIKGLDVAIQLKGSLVHLKRLSGLFSYDIKFSPEYMHCIRMKEKLPEIRKILAEKKVEGEKLQVQKDPKNNKEINKSIQ